MRRLPALLLSLVLALPVPAAAQALTVSAAASLTDAFKEIGPRFAATKPGTTVRFNFAASGVLLQQIAQGAPVDVFASADQDTMDRAAGQGLIVAATRHDFAGNSLVLITPPAGTVKSVRDLPRADVKRVALGKAASVPAGHYARQALENAGLWAELQPKLVFGDNVRQVLDYVARGEAEAGFVYRTDALLAGNRVHIAMTLGGHAPVTYPVAVVADSRQAALARDFASFLGGAEARAILARHGFGKP